MEPDDDESQYIDADSDDQELARRAACLRCHASKLRCTRARGKKDCKRCLRARVQCKTRPSRRGRIITPTTHTVREPLSNPQVSAVARPLASLTVPPFHPNLQMWPASSADFSLEHVPASTRPSNAFLDWHSTILGPSLSTEEFDLSPQTGRLFANMDSGNSVLETPFVGPAAEDGHSNTPRKGGDESPAGEYGDASTPCWTQDLTRINSVLLEHQRALRDPTERGLSPRASSALPTPKHDSGLHESLALTMEETLRVAVDFLGLLNRSCLDHHDAATILLLLSCYKRLTSVFRELYQRLKLLSEQKHSRHDARSRLLPPILIGSLTLSGVGMRLQASIVLHASEQLLEEIARCIERAIDPKRGEQSSVIATPQSSHSGVEDGLDGVMSAVLDAVHLERSIMSECVRRLQHAWVDGRDFEAT